MKRLHYSAFNVLLGVSASNLFLFHVLSIFVCTLFRNIDPEVANAVLNATIEIVGSRYLIA